MNDLTDQSYGDKTLSMSQKMRVIAAAKRGENTEDKRSSLEKKVGTDEFVEAVGAMVKEDWQITKRELVHEFHVSEETVDNTLRNGIGLSKKCAR